MVRNGVLHDKRVVKCVKRWKMVFLATGSGSKVDEMMGNGVLHHRKWL
jgi:hypothetical protein